MPIWIQWFSLSLAVVGSISGIWALVLNHQRTIILKRKEKERLEVKKKAKFNIERKKEIGSKRLQDKLILRNIGVADAQNVKVRFYKREQIGNGERQQVSVLMDGSIPSSIISGHLVNSQLFIHFDNAPPWDVVITWDDDYQKGNVLKTNLN